MIFTNVVGELTVNIQMTIRSHFVVTSRGYLDISVGPYRSRCWIADDETRQCHRRFDGSS